ncbi:MAG: PAS-domain containing protein, partial [Alphaproteobacteria bacterium]
MTPDDGAVAGSGRPRSVGRWIIVGTAAYILISGIALAVFLHYLRSEDLAASSRLVASFAQLAEEQTVRTMQTAERLLDRMRERLDTLDADSARDVAAVDGAFRSLVAGRDFLTGAWVIDANGRVLYDTGGNRGLDLSDREYFRRHRANEDLTLAVGVPLRSRASGAWFIPVTATRRLPDGSFGGVIVVALNPRPFDRVWSLDAAGEERVVALFRRDGVLLMRSPFVADAMGRSFADVEVFRDRLPTVPAGVFRTVGVIDRQDRLLAYRSLRAYPELVIVVSDRIGALLEGWRRVAWTIAIGWLAGSAAIALLAAWLVREWQRRRRSEGGLATALVSLQAKIGEHERAVADAEMARTRLADAIGVFPGSFRLFDRDGRLVLTNDVQWVEDPAVVPRVAVGMRIEDMVRTAAELELELAAVGRPEEWRRERLAQFRRGHTDTEVAWRDGRWFHLLERHTSDGGTVSLRLDITAHKKLEEQLRQAQKMEAVGQLTGGIAHDFNNMLTVIIGNAEIVTEIATDPAVRAASEQILRAAESSAELTGRLLAFARRTPLQPRPVEINRFVAGMEGLLRRTLGEDIEIGLMLAADVWAVTIDPAQLQA